MSSEELDRLEVIQRVLDKRLTQVDAGLQLGISSRQVRRLVTAFQNQGPVINLGIAESVLVSWYRLMVRIITGLSTVVRGARCLFISTTLPAGLWSWDLPLQNPHSIISIRRTDTWKLTANPLPFIVINTRFFGWTNKKQKLAPAWRSLAERCTDTIFTGRQHIFAISQKKASQNIRLSRWTNSDKVRQ